MSGFQDDYVTMLDFSDASSYVEVSPSVKSRTRVWTKLAIRSGSHQRVLGWKERESPTSGLVVLEPSRVAGNLMDRHLWYRDCKAANT
ncbi:hypothetical protein L1887_22497 [Cichorium endivia]|nr:hypothetical protein L1887_22497 [Cichorium endivia]